MKKLILPLLFFCCQNLFAQKISLNNDTALLDEKPFILIEKEGCKVFSGKCIYTIKNNAGKTLLIIAGHDISLPEKINQSNPQGKVNYSQFVFLDSIGQKAEIEKVYSNTEKLLKFIVKNKLIKDGALDAEAVRAFVLVNGTPFSDRNSIRIRQ